MRYLPFLALLGVASTNAQMLKCAADNCLRAIRASAFPSRSGTADCRSFFRSYVTATVTATATTVQTDLTATTTTLIVFDPVGVQPAKRQAGGQPSGIPAYASPCSGLVRYSSACACVGVTETADASITTVTVTSTTSITAVATTIIVSDFVMQLQDILPGKYIAKYVPGPSAAYPTFTSDIANAAVFRLLPNGNIECNGRIMYTSPFEAFMDWDWDSIWNDKLTCDIDADDMLTCTAGTANVMGVYMWEDGTPYISQSGSVTGFEARNGGRERIKVLPAPQPVGVPAP